MFFKFFFFFKQKTAYEISACLVGSEMCIRDRVSSSRGLSLRSHGPFESTQKAILDNLDILSTKDVFEPSGKRVYVEDTDEGARLKDQIADLKKLLAAYADGSVKEQA